MPVAYGGNGEAQWDEFLFWDCEMPLLMEPPGEEDDRLSAWESAGGRGPHVLNMIRNITRAYNQGISAVKSRRCGQLLKPVERRKLLLLTEYVYYISAEQLTHNKMPLGPRARRLVRK